jgi:choline-sulfatase
VQIGRLLQTLEEDLLGDTAILFGTDHGDMLGHLGADGKGPAYDTSCRTPYVLWWPERVPAGQTLTGPVESVDLPATIMDIAGLGPDPTDRIPYSPGRSFLQYASGESVPPRQWAYAEWGGGENVWRMCRETAWKYVMSPAGDQLFHLAEDPWEPQNLVGEPEHRDRVSRMRRRIIQSMIQTVTPDSIPQQPRDDWWLEREYYA